MQGRHILLLIFLAAAVVIAGCTAPENTAPDSQPPSPTPSSAPVEAVGAGQPAPTPAVPARAGGAPQSVEFVDPATYHIPSPTPTIAMTKQPNDLRVLEGMSTYAVVTSEKLSPAPRDFATEAYHIPFPYWAVNVSAVPIGDFPLITVEIRDPKDPNRVIETIRYSRNEFPTSDRKFNEKDQRFLIKEGYRDYCFVVHTESIRSFKITVYVPTKYLV
ncbi:hypothetical protein [Methanoculleus sp.]|uniref:hypothetical protein n=1 Tax=Methanoculleus sp. TaxID=90427 RepID=UPI0025CD8003|nr:hypothetical protein [Methanoculleus sp.]